MWYVFFNFLRNKTHRKGSRWNLNLSIIILYPTVAEQSPLDVMPDKKKLPIKPLSITFTINSIVFFSVHFPTIYGSIHFFRHHISFTYMKPLTVLISSQWLLWKIRPILKILSIKVYNVLLASLCKLLLNATGTV